MDYALIGNCMSSALIDKNCSIVWLCLPYFDSDSICAKILDKKKGGEFGIIASNLISITQEYIQNTSILKTKFITKDGEFDILDYMPRFYTVRHEYYCPPEIHRDIHLLSGNPKIKIVYDLKPNYASSNVNHIIQKKFIKTENTEGPHTSYYLYTNLDKKDILAGNEIELKESSFLVLSYHQKIDPFTKERVYVEYERTKSYWLSWISRTIAPEKHKAMLFRSAITLKLLTFQKTGAVIAAPTTSLPEIIGKDRNWDYRYCWVRDASMTIDTYARIGHSKSSRSYINFILNKMLLKHMEISVMYGINGEDIIEEKILPHLKGHKNSYPVRIGNAAYKQKQNDVYGELIDTIYTYFMVETRVPSHINEEVWSLVRSLVNSVEREWETSDNGIWEIRGEPRHFVYSKTMNWVAMDRAGKIAKHLGQNDYAVNCFALADIIKKDILKNGWNKKIGAFTMAYGSTDLDAANLLMLHYRFLPTDDEKMKKSVLTMYKKLVKNNFMMRYTSDDGLGTPENAFIVCTFWMINALYLIGEKDKAYEMFENIIKHANKFGLFSEDIETSTEKQTGNFPQGYSHLAFIQTVFLLFTNYNWSDYYKGVLEGKRLI